MDKADSSMSFNIAITLLFAGLVIALNVYIQDYSQAQKELEETINLYREAEEKNKNLEKKLKMNGQKIDEYQKTLTKYESMMKDYKAEVESLQKEIEKLKKSSEQAKKQPASRGEAKGLTFKATAYDLSVASCGKAIGTKGYGVTANGTKLSGKTRLQAMTVAVDPSVVPLGTKLKITFPKPYEHFTGIYTANDTGGKIKGRKIDVFMGDFRQNKAHQSVRNFGVREVKVEILK